MAEKTSEEYMQCERCKQVKPASEIVSVKVKAKFAFLKGMSGGDLDMPDYKRKNICKACLAAFNSRMG